MITRLKCWARQWAGPAPHSEFAKTVEQMRRDELAALELTLAAERLRVGRAETKLEGLGFYLAELPASRAEIVWTKDDAQALAGFLEQGAGAKLIQHLTNRLADYDRSAVLYANAQTAALLCKRAHGFRDCRGELLRLSAAGPSPANHEDAEDALPVDLENLRA